MDIGWPEILIIAVVILVLFGSRKLPDAARSLGKSMRILKTEIKGMHDENPATPAQLPSGESAPVATPATSATPSATAAGDRSDTQ